MMKRRNFLSLISAAMAAPALPAFGAAAPASTAAAAAGYTRYMYGLAVFQARTRAGISAADLVMRLGVTPAQASAMMGEMSLRGVLSSGAGALRVAATAPPRKPYVRKALRQIAESLRTSDASAPRAEPSQSDIPSARPVHSMCTTCDN